jgi:putative MATE family efflux protein
MGSSTTQATGRHGRDMTVGSIPRHLVMFSLPMLAGNSIQTAYSIVNAVWVGRGLGKTDLAAVTVSFPVIFVLIAVAAGLTMATSILVSQFAGAQNWPSLRNVVQTSTLMLTVVSLLFLIVGELATPWILRMMDTPPEVYALALGYMRIFLVSIPFWFGVFLMAAMLRGIGDSKTPLYFQASALILSAILDPLLMFGWLGFPRLGLNGTAVASVTCQGLGLTCLIVYLWKKDHIVCPDWLKLRVHWPTFWLTWKIGLPSVVQQSLVAIGMVFVLRFVNAFGENASAAFGAGSRIDQVAFLPAMTFSVAVSTLVGQNIGAGRAHRAKEVFLWGCLLCGGITVLCSLLVLCAPRLLLRMFLNDPTATSMAVHYLYTVAPCYVFFAIMFVSNGVINGSGHTLVTTVVSLTSLWVARVPLSAYLTHRMNRVEGVWYAIAVSLAVAMVMSLAYYFSGRWKTPVITHHPPMEPIEESEEVLGPVVHVE